MPRKRKQSNLEEHTPPGGRTSPKTRGGQLRNYSYTISELLRETFHPSIVKDFWAMLLQGHVPRIVEDGRATYGYRVEPDPNPMLPSPSLEQRMRATQEISNRAWGQPAQSIHIDAHLKQTQQLALPPDALGSITLKQLAKLKELFELDAGIEDAEIIEDAPKQLEETCQVASGENETDGGELQDTCQEGELQDPYQPESLGPELQEAFQHLAAQTLTLNQESDPNDEEEDDDVVGLTED